MSRNIYIYNLLSYYILTNLTPLFESSKLLNMKEIIKILPGLFHNKAAHLNRNMENISYVMNTSF